MRRKFEVLLISDGSLHLLFISWSSVGIRCLYFLFRIPTACDLLLAPDNVLFYEGLVDKTSILL
jgi:hypothetical protein